MSCDTYARRGNIKEATNYESLLMDSFLRKIGLEKQPVTTSAQWEDRLDKVCVDMTTQLPGILDTAQVVHDLFEVSELYSLVFNSNKLPDYHVARSQAWKSLPKMLKDKM